jgi:6-phosphogluconolactonase
MRFFILVLASIIVACNSNTQANNSEIKEKSDSLYLFVGSYTQDLGFVNGKGAGITVFDCDPVTGKLIKITEIKTDENPSYLSYDKVSNLLFAANENEEGSITSYNFSPEKKQLSKINTVGTLGASPCHLSINKNSNCIFSANYVSGSVSYHKFDKAGVISDAKDTITHKGKGPFAMRQEAAHLHMVSNSPYDNLLHGVDLGTDEIYHYNLSRDMIEVENTTSGLSGAGARHLVFHPTNGKVYVAYEFTNQVQVLDATKIPFEQEQIILSLDKALEKHAVTSAAIKIHPNGKFLYLSNRKGQDGTDNSISTFRIKEKTGGLTLVENLIIEESVPRDFSIDPSGKFLFVAGQNSDNIVQYQINQKEGRLMKTNHAITVNTPSVLVFSR